MTIGNQHISKEKHQICLTAKMLQTWTLVLLCYELVTPIETGSSWTLVYCLFMLKLQEYVTTLHDGFLYVERIAPGKLTVQVHNCKWFNFLLFLISPWRTLIQKLALYGWWMIQSQQKGHTNTFNCIVTIEKLSI